MIQDNDLIKAGDYVITNKGNHGKVMSVGQHTAIVKIGYKTFEIELPNLHNVNKGAMFVINYLNNDNTSCRTTLFIKHGTCLYENNVALLPTIVKKQLDEQLKQNTTILNILIP